MSGRKVIVFGASGAVGRAAALEAHQRGAQVHLSSRDIRKPIPSLPELPRVQADLTDPSSIEKAIKDTGATAAFIYLTHGVSMKPAAEALKNAGIQHVVLLSSYTIYPSYEFALKTGIISRIHAEAEMALRDAAVKFTAIRPMYFNSNLLLEKAGLRRGEIALYRPDAIDDYIAPEDIGAVAGVKLLSDDPETVPICGPQLLSKREAWETVVNELGQTVKIVGLTRDQYIEASKFGGEPSGIRTVLANHSDRPIQELYPEQLYQTASSNVKKYTGRDPISLRTWVKDHKKDFQ